jgi:Right handed beta helix region
VALRGHLGGAIVCALTAVCLQAMAGSATAATNCSLYASTGGNDSASGTAQAPFRTAQRLVDSLDNGETGCLQPGETFSEDLLRVRSSNITLASAPGGRATLAADVRIEGETGPISNVELSGMNIVGEGAADPRPLVRVVADDVRLIGNLFSNPGRTTCLNIAPLVARNIRVEGNVVRECGPPSSNTESGIGVDLGRDVVIAHNYVLNNPARGIQLYRNALGTQIHNNVVDGNADNIQFAGDSASASSGSRVNDNLVSNARGGFNVTYNWEPGGPEGTDNIVSRNCLDGANGNINTPPRGFTVTPDNTFADPRYRNRNEGPPGLGPVPSSPCADRGPHPQASTGADENLTADPTAASVITASVPGEVNPRWQPTSYRVEFGSAGSFDRQTADEDAGAGSVLEPRSALLTGLTPNTVYEYRFAAVHPSGFVSRGGTESFRTPPAPLLRPITTVGPRSRPGKNGPRIDLRVENAPSGAEIVVRCTGGRRRRCPSTQTLTVRSRNQRIPKYKRLLRPGAVVDVQVSKPGSIGQRFILKVLPSGGGNYSLRQLRQTCTAPDTGSRIACLEVRRPRSANRFRELRVLNAPIGSVVSVRCLGGRALRCPVGVDRRTVDRPLRTYRFAAYERPKFRPGARVQVFVTKPNTIGTFTEIVFRRAGRFVVGKDRDICIESEDKRPIRCPAR